MDPRRDGHGHDICKTCMSTCFFLHKNTDIDCPFNGTCDSCQAFASLEAEIADLETKLAAVSQKRQSLKTQMNNDHDRLIHRFPFEITCQIFNDVVENDGPQDKELGNPVLRLGGVCKTWRDITLNIPELWTRPTIFLWRYAIPDVFGQLEILEGWAHRSGPAPLFLTIKSQKNPISIESRDAIQGLEHVLPFLKYLRASCRWGGLNFHGPTGVIRTLFNGLEHAPSLDYLQLTFPPEGYWSPRVTVPPTLHGEFNPKSLVARASSLLVLLPLSYERLTQVDISDIAINELLHIVRVAKALRILNITSVSRPNGQQEFPMPTQPIINKSLIQLDTEKSQYVGILRHLTLPALQKLNHCFYRTGLDYIVFPDFVRRSGLRSLTSFSFIYQLDDLAYPQSDEECQYDSMPAVTHLHIEIPTSKVKTRQNILGIGERLLSPLRHPGAFPLLREISITAPLLSSKSWSYLCSFLGHDSPSTDPSTSTEEFKPWRPLERVSVRLIGEEALSKTDVMISESDCARFVEVQKCGVDICFMAVEYGDRPLDLRVLHDIVGVLKPSDG